MPERSPLAAFVGERTPRVLIVDDEPANRMVLAVLLVRWGCLVAEAADGAEALAKVRESRPDLVLLDVMMPGQSGFAVCEALRADPATRDVPVILLTALATEQAMVQGLESGGRDYVAKPFIAAELAARVGARLREKYADDTLRASQDTGERTGLADPMTGLLSRVGFEQAAARVLVECAAADQPVSLLVIRPDPIGPPGEGADVSAPVAAGEDALRAVAGSILVSRRSADVTGRYGEEELAWLLPGAADPDAMVLADALRSRHALERPTVSIGGVTMFASGAGGVPVSCAELIPRARAGLSQAREAGGSRVVWA